MVVASALVLVSGLGAQAGTSRPTMGTPMRSPAGLLATGPRANGTAVLPSGRFVTPVGTTIPVDLLPLNAFLSRDGKRLYVSSEGGDDDPREEGYNRFLTVIDTATLAKTRVRNDSLQYGIAESTDSREVYISEGATGKVRVLSVSGSTLKDTGKTIDLDSADFPWGMALHPAGRYLYVAGFSGNSMSVVDTQSKARVARLDVGHFPYTVAVSPDGKRAYLSNWGMYNADANDATRELPVEPPPLTEAGYNTSNSSSVWSFDLSDPANPKVDKKISIGSPVNGWDVLSGSLPSSMAVSPDGKTLAVSASNNDIVVLLDAVTGEVRRTISFRAVQGGPTGSQPNAMAWSPKGEALFVAEGGRDAIAVVDPDSGSIRGRIPTGWYPAAVAISPDGNRMYVANAKGLGPGPNGVEVADTEKFDVGNVAYIGNRIFGTVSVIDLPGACGSLSELSRKVDENNGLVAASDVKSGVIPAAYGQGPSEKIKHVVFILKENRTYDQVFGDLAGTERDERLAWYAEKVTPNHHAMARSFAHAQNFYDNGQDSYDGHFWIDTGQSNEFDQKVHVTAWNANKLEGNKFVTAPENFPEEGAIWNNLARAGKTFRIYGEAVWLVGVSPTILTPGGTGDPGRPASLIPGIQHLYGNMSLTYPTQVHDMAYESTDNDRADDFLRELELFNQTGQMPQFVFLWMTADHTHGAAPGKPTPETMVADNDTALGRMVEGLSHSSFWDDMAIFITEDDPQDGQDHVDAHRTIQLVISPYAKHGYVSKVHYDNMSTLKTMDLILGVPPLSTHELTATAMNDLFQSTPQAEPRYTSLPSRITPEINPEPSQAANSKLRSAAELSLDLDLGIDEGGEMLQEILRLRHEGALEAGNPNIPVLANVQEHHLASGDPVPASLTGARGNAEACGLGAASPGSLAQGGRRLPATGAAGALIALLVLAAAVATRGTLRKHSAGGRNFA